MRKELNNQSLQCYSYLTHQSRQGLFSIRKHSLHSSDSSTAVSVYTRGFLLESSTSLSLYTRSFSLQERLLIKLFTGLLNGASQYAIHKLRLKLQLLGNTLPIMMMESFAQNYTQLVFIFDLTRNTFQFPLLNRNCYSAMLITGLQYRIGSKYSMLGKMHIIQFFTKLVLFLSTMASILYTSDESDNPIQALAEYTLHFLSSMAVELLLKHRENSSVGANNVDVLNESETIPTPLHWAVYHNRGEIVNQLLAAGANINAINSLGETPLHLATTIQSGTTKIVTKLLAKGATVNAVSNAGETPLSLEILFFGRNQVIKELLLAGADLTIASADSNRRARLLFQIRGVDPNVLMDIFLANKGFTPLCLASLTFSTKPNNDRIKKSLILLIQATFLDNPMTEKPSFIQGMEHASRVWDACTEEIKRLKTPISNASISLWDICIENNVGKLASMVRNEEIREEAKKDNFMETYSYFKDRFRLNFKKGMHRAQVLGLALSTVSFWNTPLRGNKDCWGKILNYLDEKSLGHIRQVSR